MDQHRNRRSVLVNGARAAAAIVAGKFMGLFPESAAAAQPTTRPSANWTVEVLGGGDLERLRSLAAGDRDLGALEGLLRNRALLPDGATSAVRVSGPDALFEALLIGHGEGNNRLYIPTVGSIAVVGGRDVYFARNGAVSAAPPGRRMNGAPKIPLLLDLRSRSSSKGPGLAAPLRTHCAGPCDTCVFWNETCILFSIMAIWNPALIPAAMTICANAAYQCFLANQCGGCFS
jgi:hypothetical protein